MAANINIPPVAPIVPVTPDVSNFNTLINQSVATAFAANVAAQDTSILVNEDTGITTSATSAALQGDNTALNDSLTNLSPQAFVALKAEESSTPANTNLTSAQLQEMQTLQNDIAQIAAAEELAPSVTVTDNGTNLNLTVAAVTTLNDIAAVNNISSTNALTIAQIQQAAAVIAPFVNQPLTPQVLTQMQNALIAAGFNPEQISLQNLFLVMNFTVAESVEAFSPETVAMNEMIAEMGNVGEQTA